MDFVFHHPGTMELDSIFGHGFGLQVISYPTLKREKEREKEKENKIQ